MVLEEYLESNTGLLYHETQVRRIAADCKLLKLEAVVESLMVAVQVGALCGVHAINTLLQGPYISEVELGQVQSWVSVMQAAAAVSAEFAAHYDM